VPVELARKLEPAEFFHELLEHRWYLAEKRQQDVPLSEVKADYLANVLPSKPDEKDVVGVDTVEMPVVAWDD
jgi:hypothetical protein